MPGTLPTALRQTDGRRADAVAERPTRLATTVVGAAEGALFAGHDVPSRMAAGSTATVNVQLRNSGIASWTDAAGFKLGTQAPQDNTLWRGMTRVLFGAGETIPPGATKEFSFTITAPVTPGTYAFRWRMVHDTVAWFGDLTPLVHIEVI